MWGYVRRTCVFSRKAFLSINNKWLKIPTEIARWAYLSINQNQASRKGFAGQQNNPLFFKDSKSWLGCPDMRTLLDVFPVGKNYTYSEDTPYRPLSDPDRCA